MVSEDTFAVLMQERYQNKKEVYQVIPYLTRESWIEGRVKSIGASEAAAVLGMSPWMTEKELWEAKFKCKCKHKDIWNEDIARGVKEERLIRELYEIETQRDIYDGTQIILRSVKMPWMTCTLDGIFFEDGKPVIMEIKSVRRRAEWQGDQVPNHYLLQVLHQLIVTGWHKAIIRARFSASEDFTTAYEKTYEFYASDYENEMAKLAKKEKDFWNNHVLTGKPPSVRVPLV